MIKRYFATKDNTITNAFEENLKTRATGSNMGAADTLEVFSIYGQASSGSSEASRILLQFNTSQILSDRQANNIPASGSVSFYLNLADAVHSQTTPRDFVVDIYAVSSSWDEGYGIDMDNYQDLTRDNKGSNWMRKSGSHSWTSVGGDYHATPLYQQTFTSGFENLKLDVTNIVEDWLNSRKTNYGFGIQMNSSYESYFSSSSGINSGSVIHNTAGSTRSFYRKKFFARESEFFFKRPFLEARYDSTIRDNRGNFYLSSSLATGQDNLNTLYMYNYVRGRLRNIPSVGTGLLHVSIHTSSTGGSNTRVKLHTGEFRVTGGYVSTGIYSASVAVTGTHSALYDVWSSGSYVYHTGSISTNTLSAKTLTKTNPYVLSMPDLKEEYHRGQKPKLRLYAREKNWSPNIYTLASRSSVNSLLFNSASYQVRRSIDDYVVIDYGTGSLKQTGLSYDISGNYFYLDTNTFEAGYKYDIYYSIFDEDSNTYIEQPYKFRFRVVD